MEYTGSWIHGLFNYSAVIRMRGAWIRLWLFHCAIVDRYSKPGTTRSWTPKVWTWSRLDPQTLKAEKKLILLVGLEEKLVHSTQDMSGLVSLCVVHENMMQNNLPNFYVFNVNIYKKSTTKETHIRNKYTKLIDIWYLCVWLPYWYDNNLGIITTSPTYVSFSSL